MYFLFNALLFTIFPHILSNALGELNARERVRFSRVVKCSTCERVSLPLIVCIQLCIGNLGKYSRDCAASRNVIEPQTATTSETDSHTAVHIIPRSFG